jgi:hypothetical protein
VLVCAATIRLRFAVAIAPVLSVKVAVNANVPVADVVPERSPEEDRLIPVGSAPPVTAQVYGCVPPEAASASLYAVPAVAVGRVDEVIVGLEPLVGVGVGVGVGVVVDVGCVAEAVAFVLVEEVAAALLDAPPHPTVPNKNIQKIMNAKARRFKNCSNPRSRSRADYGLGCALAAQRMA